MQKVLVPTLGESVKEATVLTIKVQKGSFIKKDEIIAELETEKVTLEVYAPVSGIIESLSVNLGQTVIANQEIAIINENFSKEQEVKTQQKDEVKNTSVTPVNVGTASVSASPSALRLSAESGLSLSDVKGTGKRDQVLKEDVINHLSSPQKTTIEEKRIEVVKMSKLRQTVARRLKDAQNTAAILTTFNEVDMTEVMNLRSKYKDFFEKKHGVKVGFMSFFIKAVVAALKEIPAINAEIKNDEIIFKNYYDISVAVGTEQGLVVPVIRDCDKLSLADIEKEILNYSKKAKEGKLSMSDMQGGTFTISNGGVYGSLLSTPIINPPQSGILGLHNIVKRPVVVNDEIVIRNMMYIALSYDHRIVDGKEAVTFLVKIKNIMEDPSRLILDV